MNETATWKCIACNGDNESEGTYCGTCGRPRPWEPPPAYLFDNSHSGIPPAPPPPGAVDWPCGQCGFLNVRAHNFCIKCGSKRPPLGR